MSDALFVDLSNLNVLYKVNGTFSAAMSYSSSPEQLVYDAQALGSSFDIYLSMWPRVEAEGDTIIQGLSIGGVPFWVIRKEVMTAFAFVQKIPGVNNIYLCNALANFVIPSRVGNFHAVLCCGTRYGLVKVQDKLLESWSLYNSQQDFYAEVGSDFSCYGDLDCIDFDNIRAQYPEFTPVKRNILVSLVQLVMSYRSQHKMLLDEVISDMDGYPARAEVVTPVAEPKKVAPLPEPDPIVEEYKERPKRRLVIDWPCICMAVVTCLCLFACGIGWQLQGISDVGRNYAEYTAQYTDKADVYTPLKDIYSAGYSTASKSAAALDYAKSTSVSVVVSSMEAYTDHLMLKFSCNTPALMEEFVSYISEKYTIVGTNELGSTTNLDGSVTFEYGVTIIP